MNGKRRLFFGIEITAPWPEDYPQGRLINEGQRHMTLAFLGNVDEEKITALLPSIPKPSYSIGALGCFDSCLFLPQRNPHVVAWHVDWLEKKEKLLTYQKDLALWLKGNGFALEDRPFLPHVTVCRSPFFPREWKKAFHTLPCMGTNLHLYESLGNSTYVPYWSYPILPPFKEISHTADIAFAVYGYSLEELCRHAEFALAFRFPPILNYLSNEEAVSSIEDIVIALNSIIARVDGEVGCPLKAVSFHGQIEETTEGLLKWEMIVDV